MESDEQLYVTDRARLRQRLPWLHLFRAFRIAFAPKPILLAIAAVLLIDAGQQVIRMMPFSTGDTSTYREWANAFDEEARQSMAVDPERFATDTVRSLSGAAIHGDKIIRPLWTIVSPGRSLFLRGNSWAQDATAWSKLLWALIVWSLFGVAIARTAALRFAADASLSLRESLRFSIQKLASSLGAPLLPLVGVFLLWMLCLALGLFGRIPMVGPAVVGVLWGIPLLLAGLMTVVLLAIAASWPLMLSSVGTEDADAFDAFSRVFSYLFSRPWYALWLAVVALFYGSLLLAFLATMIEILLPLSEWAVASGMGEGRLRDMRLGGGDSIGLATGGVYIWDRVVGLALVGFATSYFWSATTIIYFLLRKSVDAISLDSVSLPRAEPTPESEEDALPLVGVAAAEQREQQDELASGSE